MALSPGELAKRSFDWEGKDCGMPYQFMEILRLASLAQNDTSVCCKGSDNNNTSFLTVTYGSHSGRAGKTKFWLSGEGLRDAVSVHGDSSTTNHRFFAQNDTSLCCKGSDNNNTSFLTVTYGSLRESWQNEVLTERVRTAECRISSRRFFDYEP